LPFVLSYEVRNAFMVLSVVTVMGRDFFNDNYGRAINTILFRLFEH